jgi:hypothetical protein
MKKYWIGLIAVLLIGIYFYYSNRPVVNFEQKFYTTNELERALEELEFEVKLPANMPGGVTPRGSAIYIYDGQHRMFEITYLNEENTGGFRLYASLHAGSLEDHTRQDEYWDWEEIAINGRQAYIGISDSTSEIKLIYRSDDVFYTLDSLSMDRDELTVVLGSLQ